MAHVWGAAEVSMMTEGQAGHAGHSANARADARTKARASSVAISKL